MAERNQRPVFDGSKRRAPERRRALRRKSDIAMTVLKYLAAAIIAAILVKLLG